MIKSANDMNFDKAKNDVFLKDGTSYIGCDIASGFKDMNGNVYVFWHGNTLKIVPLSNIAYIDIYENT